MKTQQAFYIAKFCKTLLGFMCKYNQTREGWGWETKKGSKTKQFHVAGVDNSAV